jgi:hypothetical protein
VKRRRTQEGHCRAPCCCRWRFKARFATCSSISPRITFLNSGYTLSNAGASGAPLGDMMVIVGTWAFGSYAAGKAFMLVQAGTVFLALIGTTLLHQHGRAGDLCDGPGRRSAVALRPGPWQHALSAPRDLDAGVISAIIGIITTVAYLGGNRRRRRWTSTTFGTASASFSPAFYASCPTRWSSSR